jgi:malonyl-CoA O-methyltransferase
MPQQFTKNAIIRSFNRAAHTYDKAAILQCEIGKRLLERLDFMHIQPEIILDLGAGTGFCTRLLMKRYKQAKVISYDIAENMQRKNKKQKSWFSRQRFVCGDAEYLPFANHSVDLIFSNLTLHWCVDMQRLTNELQRVLKPNGLLLFSTVGPDTLQELRASWARVDQKIHVHNFTDMHDWGDMLVGSRFLDPVMDMEYLTFTYSDLKILFQDLKRSGASNIAENRHLGLTGKQHWQSFLKHYENYRNAEGRLPATYEIIYGHAWGAQSLAGMNEQGEVKIAINDILKVT